MRIELGRLRSAREAARSILEPGWIFGGWTVPGAFERERGELLPGETVPLWDDVEPEYLHAPDLEHLPGYVADELRLGSRLGRAADRAAACGEFVSASVCTGCGAERAAESRVETCSVRGCPDCERERAADMRRFVGPLASAPAEQLRFLTLTVPSVPELTADLPGETGKVQANLLSHLSDLFRQLRELFGGRAGRGGAPVCFDCKKFAWKNPPRLAWKRALPRCTCARPNVTRTWIRAALRAIEVTRNPALEGNGWHPHVHGWHPHVHALVWSSYLPQETLAAAWTELTRAYWPTGPANGMGVDVRAIRDKAGRTAREEGFTLRDALAELLKYPVKTVSLVGLPHAVRDWFRAARGRRFVQGSGEWAAWRSVVEDEDEAQDDGEAPALVPCEACGGHGRVRVRLSCGPP